MVGRSETDQSITEFPSIRFLPAVSYDTGLVAAAALSRLGMEYTSNFKAVVSSLEHLGFVTDYWQNIVHGDETLTRNAGVSEIISNNSSAVYRGNVEETYKGDVTENVARGMAVIVNDSLRLKVRGMRDERVSGKLCYVQRGVGCSVCLGIRAVIVAGVHVSAGMLRVKLYGERNLAYAFALLTNGVFHLEQYQLVQSRTYVKSSDIRLVLRNVGTPAASTTPPPMHGRSLPPLPTSAAACSEMSGFADESMPMEVVS